MSKQARTWCDEDDHKSYEYHIDFNEWLDSDLGKEVKDEYELNKLSQPSKAFFSGDRNGYDQAYKIYRRERTDEALNKQYLSDQFSDNHWFERNERRFEQLVNRLRSKDVVPFIGAGLSVAGGYPTWANHLRAQGRTSGIDPEHTEELLSNGDYEKVIQEIESKNGKEVFIQEVRDAFLKTGKLTKTTLLISELFKDTLLTTNYDRLLEQAYDTGEKDSFEIITSEDILKDPNASKISIIKLHGDIENPEKCILSKRQYDKAYGKNRIDPELPIPKLLEYYYKNISLLFLGSSLKGDRTIEVFKEIKSKLSEDIIIPQHFAIEQAPENEEELVQRNTFLSKLNITAIWFEKGEFQYIDEILRLARNDLRLSGNIL